MDLSFRDPAGHLFVSRGRIFRFVKNSAAGDLKAFLSTNAARKFTDLHQLVRTDFLNDESILLSPDQIGETTELTDGVIVEHEKIPFPSYPYEWPPEMLHAAGRLTIDMAQQLLTEGFGIKDATPYNVLFDGSSPVFIDLLSFERREPNDPTWTAYAQFVRTFMLPLLVNKRSGLRFNELLITHRDGIEPDQVYRMSSWWQKIRPESLSLVSIPYWLTAKKGAADASIYRKRSVGNPEKARYILNRLFEGLQRRLDKLTPDLDTKSTWSDYTNQNRYTDGYVPDKESFVKSAIVEFGPRRVLDAGCNTGQFSRIAAANGASVVAIDYDPVVVGEVWRTARTEQLDILPLVVDLTRPTPAVGWRNAECPSFLDRARGNFDAVLMLAVIHHMLVSERIPLVEILRLASELTTNILVIEFVAPEDPMFRRLTRGRERLHEDLNRDVFERSAGQFFDKISSRRLGESDRWIYLMRKKEASTSA